MAPTSDIERTVGLEFRRKLRQLSTPQAVMSPADRLDVIKRLVRVLDGDARQGFEPSPTQALKLSAHAFKLAVELWRA